MQWRAMPLALGMLALALTGCGGGGGDSDSSSDGGGGTTPVPSEPSTPSTPSGPSVPSTPPRQQGQLLSAQSLSEIGVESFTAAVAAGTGRIPPLQPRYSVATYRLTYLTRDADGALVEASGLVAVPKKAAGAAGSPVLGYQHATTFTNAEAPSLNLAPSEPPLVLASLGYIVVAADYVGFAHSNASAHPYLQSQATARAVLDMLDAAQQWRRAAQVADNGQLYLLGYSEGGYATMAAHREMERSHSPLLPQLRATLPAAGPFDMQVTLDTQLERVRDEYPAVGWMLSPGALSHLGSTVRDEVRRLLLRALVPADADVRYDARFLDTYLADDKETLREQNSVHWGWTPSVPVYLFHGRDDATVPFAASVSAYDTLRASGGAPVSLRECNSVVPSGHTACVPEYFGYALAVMGTAP
ncbi:MAG: lipase family protein [Acidovorax sp.]|uniref:alpha/beta hydrolase family protein n=1 Tax=Acidovorax sp. TaxID=1872122 RepID=UPI0025C29D37|nr:lipase family protein [Acidovorax sp.]MCE1193175.1 lipase family protein [Acidovorax sp.]